MEGKNNNLSLSRDTNEVKIIILHMASLNFTKLLALLIPESLNNGNTLIETYAQFKAYLNDIISPFNPKLSELGYRLSNKTHSSAEEVSQMTQLGLIKSNLYAPTEMCRHENNKQQCLSNNKLRIDTINKAILKVQQV